MKKLTAILLVLILILSLTACGSSSTTDNRVKAPKSSSDLKGKDYKDVITLFESAGFTNIEMEIIDDLILGWLIEDGEVEKVSINGDTEFVLNSKFPADAKVMITYHTFIIEETAPATEKANVPESTEAAETEQVTESSDAPKTSEAEETSLATSESTSLTAISLDLNEINNTDSASSDAQFVGKFYKVTGIVDQAMEPSDGSNALVIIEPDVLAKGMGLTSPLEINIWLTAEEFESIGGISSVGKKIALTAKLTSISRNANSKDPEINGYPIQLEFGDYN